MTDTRRPSVSTDSAAAAWSLRNPVRVRWSCVSCARPASASLEPRGSAPSACAACARVRRGAVLAPALRVTCPLPGQPRASGADRQRPAPCCCPTPRRLPAKPRGYLRWPGGSRAQGDRSSKFWIPAPRRPAGLPAARAKPCPPPVRCGAGTRPRTVINTRAASRGSAPVAPALTVSPRCAGQPDQAGNGDPGRRDRRARQRLGVRPAPGTDGATRRQRVECREARVSLCRRACARHRSASSVLCLAASWCCEVGRSRQACDELALDRRGGRQPAARTAWRGRRRSAATDSRREE